MIAPVSRKSTVILHKSSGKQQQGLDAVTPSQKNVSMFAAIIAHPPTMPESSQKTSFHQNSDIF